MKKIAGLTLAALMLTSSLGMATASANELVTTPAIAEVDVKPGPLRFVFDTPTAEVTVGGGILVGDAGISQGEISFGGTLQNLTFEGQTISFDLDGSSGVTPAETTFTINALRLAESKDDTTVDFTISRQAVLDHLDKLTPATITVTATTVSTDVQPD